MKTIAKNRKALVESILAGGSGFRVYSLDNGFRGESMEGRPGNIMAPADWMRKEIYTGWKVKLTSNTNGHYTVRIHSNLWFEFESTVIA